MTSLALCKVNKSEMFLRRLSQRVRHERTDELFWKTHDVPHEALEILKACPVQAVCFMLDLSSFHAWMTCSLPAEECVVLPGESLLRLR